MTREAIIEAGAKGLRDGADDFTKNDDSGLRVYTDEEWDALIHPMNVIDGVVQAVEGTPEAMARAVLTATLPGITKDLAAKVRDLADPMGDPDPAWVAGLESAARLIEGWDLT